MGYGYAVSPASNLVSTLRYRSFARPVESIFNCTPFNIALLLEYLSSPSSVISLEQITPSPQKNSNEKCVYGPPYGKVIMNINVSLLLLPPIGSGISRSVEQAKPSLSLLQYTTYGKFFTVLSFDFENPSVLIRFLPPSQLKLYLSPDAERLSVRRPLPPLREAGPVLLLDQNGLQGNSPDSFQSAGCQQRAGKYQPGRDCRRSWSSSSECVVLGTSGISTSAPGEERSGRRFFFFFF